MRVVAFDHDGDVSALVQRVSCRPARIQRLERWREHDHLVLLPSTST
ncbi:hypothetical protein MPTA5024_07770 [Microbispora sp. ATCC PTA-5024]|nr:hypothetical protein MPTA5024_07770 [Microbispora sp. ATCC PTA-5024]